MPLSPQHRDPQKLQMKMLEAPGRHRQQQQRRRQAGPATIISSAALLLSVLCAVDSALAAAAGSKFISNGDKKIWPAPSEPPDGVAKLGLNVPFSPEYHEQLRALNRNADPSVVDKLLRSQLLWRRATSKPNDEAVRQRYSLIDCTPMYIHQRSWIDVLRKVTLKMYVCHQICLDYPACTTTTPLAQVETPGPTAPGDSTPAGRRLAMLVQCGTRVFRADVGENVQTNQIMELVTSTAGAVCSNTAARARNYEGGTLQYFAVDAGAGTKNISVWAATSEAQLKDGLLINMNDLWSTADVKPLRLLNADPNTDFWTRILAPLKGALDLRASVNQVAAALDAAGTEQQDLKALWLVTPNVSVPLFFVGQLGSGLGGEQCWVLGWCDVACGRPYLHQHRSSVSLHLAPPHPAPPTNNNTRSRTATPQQRSCTPWTPPAQGGWASPLPGLALAAPPPSTLPTQTPAPALALLCSTPWKRWGPTWPASRLLSALVGPVTHPTTQSTKRPPPALPPNACLMQSRTRSRCKRRCTWWRKRRQSAAAAQLPRSLGSTRSRAFPQQSAGLPTPCLRSRWFCRVAPTRRRSWTRV